MSDVTIQDGVRKITLDSGVSLNLISKPSDDLETQIRHSLIDVIIQMRGEVPNRDLGAADTFMAVGEWGLVLGELNAVAEEAEELGAFAKGALKLANSLCSAGEADA